MSYHYSSPRLYRSRRGIFLGVCRGIGEYLNLSIGWIRLLLVIAFIFTGFFPVVILYILAGLVMKKEPYCLYY